MYQSPILPILQHEVGGCILLTLNSLIDEFLHNNRLIEQYDWIQTGEYIAELNSAALKIRAAQQSAISKKMKELKPFAKNFLENYCRKNGITPPKQLSARDLELLATAVVFDCDIATDEEPLALIIKELHDDDINIKRLTSFDLLHLFESNTKLTSEQRKLTVSNWISKNEKLHKGWRTDYESLFGESSHDI